MASMLRAAAFSSWGLVAFTRPAFDRASKSFSPLPSMKGKKVLVTGASSGLGLASSKEYARLGADVVLICRDQTRGEKARLEVEKESSGGRISLALLDLSKLGSIASFVTQLAATEPTPYDVLVNNAGLLNNEFRKTPEGLEETYATNVLGTLQLTMLMIPHLKEGGKVITVSSGGAYTACISDLVPLQPKFDGVSAYAAHKRFQIEVSLLFARLYPQLNFYACHPGWALTPGVETSLPSLTSLPLRSSEQGADVMVWLGATPESELKNGGFYFDRAEAIRHMKLAGTEPKAGETEDVLKKLVGELEAVVGKVDYKDGLTEKLGK